MWFICFIVVEAIMNDYIVYCASHLNNIVYIGSGKNGRQKHCTSGTSSCKLLNELYFKSEDKLVISILHSDLTKEQSLVLEKELISKYRPRGNIQFLNNSRQAKGSSRAVLFKQIDKDFENCSYKNRTNRDLWKETLKECIKHYDLTVGNPIAVSSTSKLRSNPIAQRIFRIYWRSLQGCSTVKLVPEIHQLYVKYLKLTLIDKVFYLELL